MDDRDLIISRHHEWRGPASYDKADRDMVVCVHCGVRCEIGKWRTVPRCSPKVEKRSSGYRGWPLSAYLKRSAREPEKYPWPKTVFS